MEILINEDRIISNKSLEKVLLKLKSSFCADSQLRSINDAAQYLFKSEQGEVIFIDSQNSATINWEFLRTLQLNCPIVILPQTDTTDIPHIKTLPPQFPSGSSGQLTTYPEEQNKKKNFLVYKGNKYLTVKTEDIAYIYINCKTPSIVTFTGEEFSISQSLDKVQNCLSEKQFFRLNRQYLINFTAVKEVEHYFGRKLFVKLIISTPEKLLVGKERSSTFLRWLEDK